MTLKKFWLKQWIDFAKRNPERNKDLRVGELRISVCDSSVRIFEISPKGRCQLGSMMCV